MELAIRILESCNLIMQHVSHRNAVVPAIAMTTEKRGSRVQLSVDLDLPGRQIGELRFRWSDNRCPLGFYASPVIKIGNSNYPTVMMIAGIHGDEFEGPAALMQLSSMLADKEVDGRVIIFPAINAQAMEATSRVSPLDGENLNRAFPGDPDGGPTAMLAHFLESSLIPKCDAVIDLHSGGKASVFEPCVLATRTQSTELFERNLDLARAFGLDYIWVLGSYNDDRSLNSAAARCGVPMIAAELGGGGGVDPAIVERAVSGLMRFLAHSGALKGNHGFASESGSTLVEISSAEQNLHSPARGLFQRKFSAGQFVARNQTAGWLHFIDEPDRGSIEIVFKQAGLALAHTNRGMVERGDMLALVASPVDS